MKKILFGLAIGLVILGVVAVVVLSTMLGSIIKAGVEKGGPSITQTTLRLDSARVGLFSGSGAMHGFTLGNPQGYKSDFAIKVGTASVSLEPKSLFTDKIHLKQVLVLEPEITFEGGLGSKNNLSKIMENVQAATGAQGKPAPGKEKPAAGKKIQVDEFVLRGAKVHLNLSVGPLGSAKTTVPLPDLQLKDLGKDGDGLTGAELTEKVLKEVIASVLQVAQKAVADASKVGGQGLDAVKGGLKGLLGK